MFRLASVVALACASASCIGHWGYDHQRRVVVDRHEDPARLTSAQLRMIEILGRGNNISFEVTSAECDQAWTQQDRVTTVEKWEHGHLWPSLFIVAVGAASGALAVAGDQAVLGYGMFAFSGVFLGRVVASVAPRTRSHVEIARSDGRGHVDCGAVTSPEQFTLNTPWGTTSAGQPGVLDETTGKRGDPYFHYDTSSLDGLDSSALHQRLRGTGEWVIVHAGGLRFNRPIGQEMDGIEAGIGHRSYDDVPAGGDPDAGVAVEPIPDHLRSEVEAWIAFGNEVAAAADDAISITQRLDHDCDPMSDALEALASSPDAEAIRAVNSDPDFSRYSEAIQQQYRHELTMMIAHLAANISSCQDDPGVEAALIQLGLKYW